MPHPLFLVVSVLHLFSTVRVVGGFFFYISLRGERAVVPRNGGLLWQGAPAGRALVVVRLRLASGWPVSDDFVGFRAWESWRHGPRALEWRRVGAGRLCLTETAGGYRRITVASAIRAIEAEAEQHNHFG